jgi:diguanylate cyclase (GGDEF)-like protein/PAS domain S-box-containing protein
MGGTAHAQDFVISPEGQEKVTSPTIPSTLGRSLLRRLSGIGIRGRLVLLVLGLGVPFLGYIVYNAAEQLARERAVAKERSLAFARIVAARIDDYVGDVNQLLATLSYTVPTAPGSAAENDALLRRLGPNLPSHVNNVAVWDLAGNNVGSLDPVLRAHPFSVADRSYFRAALGGGELAVEAPIVSRSNGEAIVQFARAVHRGETAVGVVSASIQLKQMQSLLNPEGALPSDSVITVMNQRGIIVARSIDPDRWIGQSIATQHGIMEGIAQREGVSESEGRVLDSVARLGGFSTARSVQWFVYVGVPTDAALAPLRRQLLENLLMGVAAIVLGFIIAALIGESIARPLRQLAKDAAVLAQGDLEHRSEVSGFGESGRLAGSLNVMAQALNDRALAHARSEQRLRLITDNVPAFISYIGHDRRYKFVNAMYRDLFGLAPEDLLDKTVEEIRGEGAYQEIRPRLDEALGGLPVHFEQTYHGPKGAHTLNITYLPDYGESDGTEVRGVYVMGVDVTQRKALETKLARMAEHDQLTGLPNRYLLHDRLAQACGRSQREGLQIALFYLDLDGFKRINDTHGHAAGDAILQEIARRATVMVRATDTVARIGGDEFVVLMEGFFSYKQLDGVGRKIIAAFEAPFMVEGRALELSASVGVATFPPSKSWEELLATADAAMYEAKAAGSGSVIIAPLKAEEKAQLAWARQGRPRDVS